MQSQRIESLTNCYIAGPALAELFGVTPDMVGKYARDYGMPKAGHGKYILKDCIRWHLDRLRIAAAGGESNDVGNEKLKLTRAQRQRAEIENQKARNELIDADLVGEALNGMASIFSSQLDGLGARMASQLSAIDDPGEIQRLLLDECRSIRSSTATVAQNFAANHNGGTYSGAATG